MEELKKVFELFKINDNELYERFSEVSTIQKYKIGEIIFNGGISEDCIIINIDGIQRVYFSDSEGSELTYCFSYKFGSCMASPTFTLDGDTMLSVDALTCSTVCIISLKSFLKLCNDFPILSEIYDELINLDYVCQNTHKLVITTKTAEQRYLWFLENYDGLIERVPHKYIASFLNITPVTLSRTRKKLSETK